jgi:hypothetical protein
MHYATKKYEKVEVWLHAFLTSALGSDEQSASCLHHFTPEERGPWYPLDRRLSEPHNWSGQVKRKI